MKMIDWHAGFVSAMKLELIDNKERTGGSNYVQCSR